MSTNALFNIAQFRYLPSVTVANFVAFYSIILAIPVPTLCVQYKLLLGLCAIVFLCRELKQRHARILYEKFTANVHTEQLQTDCCFSVIYFFTACFYIVGPT